jgi:hypothetical protein
MIARMEKARFWASPKMSQYVSDVTPLAQGIFMLGIQIILKAGKGAVGYKQTSICVHPQLIKEEAATGLQTILQDLKNDQRESEPTCQNVPKKQSSNGWENTKILGRRIHLTLISAPLFSLYYYVLLIATTIFTHRHMKYYYLWYYVCKIINVESTHIILEGFWAIAQIRVK